jgi:hypothetical protein
MLFHQSFIDQGQDRSRNSVSSTLQYRDSRAAFFVRVSTGFTTASSNGYCYQRLRSKPSSAYEGTCKIGYVVSNLDAPGNLDLEIPHTGVPPEFPNPQHQRPDLGTTHGPIVNLDDSCAYRDGDPAPLEDQTGKDGMPLASRRKWSRVPSGPEN